MRTSKKSGLGGLTAQQHEQLCRQSSRYAAYCEQTTPLWKVVVGLAALASALALTQMVKADEPPCAKEVSQTVTFTNLSGQLRREHRTIIKTPGGSVGIRVCASNEWPVAIYMQNSRCGTNHWHFLTTVTNSGTVVVPSRFKWMWFRFDEGPK